MLDATYDCKSENLKSGKGYAAFMLPLEDLMNFKDTKMIQYEDSFDQFLSGFGIDNEFSAIPPVVRKYKDRSKPIPYNTLEKVIKKALKIIFYIKDEDALNERLEIEMRLSRVIAHNRFSINAINSIYQESKKYTYN